MWLCWRPALSLREPPTSHRPSSLKVLFGSRSASLNAPGCFRWASFPLLSFQGFGQEGSLNKFACSSLCQFGGFGQFFGFDQSGVPWRVWEVAQGPVMELCCLSGAASPALPSTGELQNTPQAFGQVQSNRSNSQECGRVALLGVWSFCLQLYGQIRSWLSKA